MKPQTSTDILSRDILLLEAKRKMEFADLKEHLHSTYESLRPINLIKSTFEDVTHSPDIKGGIGKAAIGMATGYLLKKVVFGSSINPLKNIAGAAFQALVTNVAAKNSDKIKEGGLNIVEIAKSLFMSRRKRNQRNHDEE